ncbi:hypothetical protein DEU56DRAFT_820070 [Suillus clintonianus]|uniref:uncharacterized protein n=1 Tax=Suillus clintonianus TaxID=1904413 RepID=UPI001B8795B9|nr:uncharacterized protein DEU56DRAFT_820070 [Suillus clintonianus]KAG2127689.1 hypothetical protein DEU56DRAFT_820070 [Suillus clintonianus]
MGMTRVTRTNFCLEFTQSERVIELLGLNYGYKDGLYYIKSSSNLGCYASIRYGEDVLCGVRINPMEYSQKWRLTQVNQSDASGRPQFFCALTKEEDNGSLGVKAIKNSEPVYSITGSHSWFLRQNEEGYTIGLIAHENANEIEYTWCLGNDYEPVRAHPFFVKCLCLTSADRDQHAGLR